MKQRNHPSKRAFTLIELLVVVAIIALLISILLPSLKRAREQARISKCLANLRSITQAGSAYVLDHESLVFTFPQNYKVDGDRRSWRLFTEFIWGGGVPDVGRNDWDESQGPDNPVRLDADVYIFTPDERPMNDYITPGVAWANRDRHKRDGTGNQLRRDIPTGLPDVFKCPSDTTAGVPNVQRSSEPPPEPESIFQTWRFWGTSYPINWYWAYYYAGPGNENAATLGVLTGRLGQRLLAEKTQRGSAEFILFYENQFNFALEGARARGYEDDPRSLPGWHGQQDFHSAGFFDGHAVYRRFNTTAIDGPGWTTWPSRPWTGTGWETYEDN